jgi:hypothetical protein
MIDQYGKPIKKPDKEKEKVIEEVEDFKKLVKDAPVVDLTEEPDK